MEGVIVNFRRGRHTVHTTHMIVQVADVDSKEKARALVGKSVVWASSAKNEIKGRVAKEHGRNGALRVIFQRGMPGQSIGQKVAIE